ncbi:MAG: hypothetical protein OIF50_01215 [Flavobacteriaceae bacterium]|nr:hypothetical protein [Flavobacteriaceae bacterium]
MFQILKKMVLYAVLIFLVLEALVRIFHLYDDEPTWYLDKKDNTYKWVPGQEGYAVYGNRRQSFTKYHINTEGYNSYRDFAPTEDKVEVAIMGDSFIEGFHQNYFNSIGKKIESKLPHLEVYEYGHSSFDFADQAYLVYSNKEVFKKVDHLIFEIKFRNDFQRSEYSVAPRTVVFPLLRKSKLLKYMLDIGMVDPVKKTLRKLNIVGQVPYSPPKDIQDLDSLYLSNFKKLHKMYEIDKSKSCFLLDSRQTAQIFLDYLDEEGIAYIDYGKVFEENKKRPTTLVYDRHWNNYGRQLVANEIYKYLEACQCAYSK